MKTPKELIDENERKQAEFTRQKAEIQAKLEQLAEAETLGALDKKATNLWHKNPE